MDHYVYLPNFAVIAEGKIHEITVAKKLHFSPGTILVFDSNIGRKVSETPIDIRLVIVKSCCITANEPVCL